MTAITGEQAYAALVRIHQAMSVPFDWSADTPEAVADVITSLGFKFPEENEVFEMEEAVGRGVITETMGQRLATLRPAFDPGIGHDVTVTAYESDGEDGAIVVEIGTQFEPDPNVPTDYGLFTWEAIALFVYVQWYADDGHVWAKVADHARDMYDEIVAWRDWTDEDDDG